MSFTARHLTCTTASCIIHAVLAGRAALSLVAQHCRDLHLYVDGLGLLLVVAAAAGSFSYVKSRAVCKQEGHVRLKDVAASQVSRRGCSSA
jgi:hypothetical protein